MLKSSENIKWDNPHVFTFLLLLITLLLLIHYRIRSLEEKIGFRFRYMLIGISMAFVLYYFEGYFLG